MHSKVRRPPLLSCGKILKMSRVHNPSCWPSRNSVSQDSKHPAVWAPACRAQVRDRRGPGGPHHGKRVGCQADTEPLSGLVSTHKGQKRISEQGHGCEEGHQSQFHPSIFLELHLMTMGVTADHCFLFFSSFPSASCVLLSFTFKPVIRTAPGQVKHLGRNYFVLEW